MLKRERETERDREVKTGRGGRNKVGTSHTGKRSGGTFVPVKLETKAGCFVGESRDGFRL